MIDFKAMFKDFEFPFTVEEGKDDYYCLGLPLFYTDGDGVEIYVKKCPNGTFTMSDDGWTLGVHSCFDRRNIEVVKRIINHTDFTRYDEESDEISATSTERDFAVALLEMASVMVAANYAVTALRGMKVTKNADQDARKE